MPHSETPEAFFALTVILKNGIPIVVVRPKALDRYIVFQSTLKVSPEHKVLLHELTEEQRGRLSEELALEIARSKAGFAITDPLETITLTRRIALTSGLTEEAFMARLDEVEADFVLARETFRLVLDTLRRENAGPSSPSSSSPEEDTEPPM